MGVRERKEREREARRRLVLDATRELLRERGLTGVTTKGIAERCELSEATLFWYFENKDDILTTLVFEGTEMMSRRFDEILRSDRAPRDKLTDLVMFLVDIRTSYPEYSQVFTYLAQPEGKLAISKPLKLELARHTGNLFRRMAELVREVCGPTDARVRTDLLWAVSSGLWILRDARTNLELGEKVHPSDSELRRALQLALDGIVGPRTPDKRGGRS